ncbi:MAG TPA: succinate dehydrogenase cytochrome b subunit, partial [Planctomycetota bacterium]
GLLAIFLLHVGAAIKVTRANRAARPDPYRFPATVQTTYAARTMVMSGLIVAAFVVYHLLHFTLGAVHGEHFGALDAAGRPDVHRMVVASFREWPITAAYLVAQVLLGMHIAHGASSAFQSLGVTHPRLAFLKTGFGPGVATVIVLGNVSIPLACLIGLVPPSA